MHPGIPPDRSAAPAAIAAAPDCAPHAPQAHPRAPSPPACDKSSAPELTSGPASSPESPSAAAHPPPAARASVMTPATTRHSVPSSHCAAGSHGPPRASLPQSRSPLHPARAPHPPDATTQSSRDAARAPHRQSLPPARHQPVRDATPPSIHRDDGVYRPHRSAARIRNQSSCSWFPQPMLIEWSPAYCCPLPTIFWNGAPGSRACRLKGKPLLSSTSQFPHRRYNPLRRQWVLVSPHRTQRPWQGEVNPSSGFSDVRYDPNCYLCPGNKRAGGHTTPVYESVFIFDNDYAALLPDSPAPEPTASPLLRSERERGRCKVICFHPDHSLTLARMALPDIRKVVDAWTTEYEGLSRQPDLRYVQIFENRGAMMGASNPHPHCQIWATEHVPDEPAAERANLKQWRETHGSGLLADYVKLEVEQKERIVCQNDAFVAVVPYWAVWPFETLVLARQPLRELPEFSAAQRRALADILSQLTIRYDNLFQTSFPYTMGFHQGPGSEQHFHAHFYPPLLRSATVKKFMVGFEMLGMPQRDILPEDAAARLREVPATHYLGSRA